MNIDELTRIVERSLADAGHLDEHARKNLFRLCVIKEASRQGHQINDDLIETLMSAVGRKMAHHRLQKQEREHREAMDALYEDKMRKSMWEKTIEAHEDICPIS